MTMQTRLSTRPPILFPPTILFLLKHHVKSKKPRTTPSVRKVARGERRMKKQREKKASKFYSETQIGRSCKSINLSVCLLSKKAVKFFEIFVKVSLLITNTSPSAFDIQSCGKKITVSLLIENG